MSVPKLDPSILNFDKPHRAKIIKVCKTCGKRYYPRANGYELISKYCGQPCYRNARLGDD